MTVLTRAGSATLFVADTHFGKAGVFRRHGMGLPQGTTDADLARLGTAIAATEASRVVVLGDFVHAPPAADEPWLARFAAWRAGHAGVDFRVLRGNHDRMDAVPAALDTYGALQALQKLHDRLKLDALDGGPGDPGQASFLQPFTPLHVPPAYATPAPFAGGASFFAPAPPASVSESLSHVKAQIEGFLA